MQDVQVFIICDDSISRHAQELVNKRKQIRSAPRAVLKYLVFCDLSLVEEVGVQSLELAHQSEQRILIAETELPDCQNMVLVW